MNDILDCKKRVMDDIYLYYGKERISNIDKSKLTNHSFKMREKHKLPKCGQYCMPEELFGKIGIEYATKINKMFRNVQYIAVGNILYWVYCLDMEGLQDFYFIGDNVSAVISNRVLTGKGYKLGFKREYDANGYKLSKAVEVWFQPESLLLIVLKIPVYHFFILNRCMYYRKFESEKITNNTKYTSITDDIIIRIPLTDSYHDNDEVLVWPEIIDVSVDEDESGHVMTRADYDANCLLFDQGDYKEMLEIMFNAVLE